ncbi:TetR/AcrR family transcriptional regulator [Aliihoeflea sp. PC F10.4]
MGRHRAFDPDTALDNMLAVFWKKGFEGTSYADLTKAAGVERPALYSAFGNKEALFAKVLDRYYEQYLAYVPAALDLPTAREAAAHVLYGAVDLNTRFDDHTGCLGINGVLAGSDDAEPIRQALIDARAKGRDALVERFKRARHEGDLPETACPETLATFVMTVTHGVAVQAKAGVSRDVLTAVVDQALSTWPTSTASQTV